MVIPTGLLVRGLLAAALAAGAFAASRAGAQQVPPTTVPTPAEVEEELRDFVPTEEIPADSAVSFPSDI
jgi:ABC-type nitrate/sulfonate/bicarbonate transport system permease component